MMKKLAVISTVLIFSLVLFSSCAKKPSAPKAGSTKVDDMLSLIPSDVQGVLFIDFHKAITTELAEKALKDEKTRKKYQEFVDETGIDLKKDLFFVAGALSKGMGKEEQKGAFILNLRYDKETFLNKIKKGGELKEEDYNGITLFSAGEEEEWTGAFLDDSNLIAGSENEVKSVIDTYQQKSENVFQNENLAAIIDQTNKEALFWAAFLIPAEAAKQVSAQNPMLKNLESIKAANLSFDYKNKNLIAEIKVMSGDETKNQEIVDLLKGFKAMGVMAAAEDPDVSELLSKIEITSEGGLQRDMRIERGKRKRNLFRIIFGFLIPDKGKRMKKTEEITLKQAHVKIYAKIPEELINRLTEKKEKESNF